MISIQPTTPTSTPATATVDDRIIAMMRFILAFSALLITIVDPSEPDRLVAITYAALSLYTIYSAALYVIVQRFQEFQAAIRKWTHWADVGRFCDRAERAEYGDR